MIFFVENATQGRKQTQWLQQFCPLHSKAASCAKLCTICNHCLRQCGRVVTPKNLAHQELHIVTTFLAQRWLQKQPVSMLLEKKFPWGWGGGGHGTRCP